MSYTQIKIKENYRRKLAELAMAEHRSMANLIEVLIDQEAERVGAHSALNHAAGEETEPMPTDRDKEENPR